jgi:hypothetical protein
MLECKLQFASHYGQTQVCTPAILTVMKTLSILPLLLLSVISSLQSNGQETTHVPSKLQLAVEPEEIVLTRGITTGSPEKKIQVVVRETSGINPAKLELAARPFTDTNAGDVVDVSVVTVTISTLQVALSPGGLERVEVTIGGFKQAGSYLGGITVHDTVSGERREIPVRVSVKDSYGFPTFILLASVLIASGVNYWTRKGRRKNRLDRRVTELQKTIKLAGGDGDLILFDAEQFLEKAQVYNQDYQFDRAEAAIAGVEQKLAQYEQRKQGSEQLRQKIQELLHEIRELGESDPQHTRIADELMQLLPKVQSDYEQTSAIVKQLEMFLRAYRLARKDLQSAREKLLSNVEYVKKAGRSRIELLFRDIERILASAENMNAIDEANVLLRKAAYELSPEKIHENIFREQKLRKILEDYEQHIKRISGDQVKRIVLAWYEKAASALGDHRYEDVDDALQKLDKTIALVEWIKRAEQRIKGRDQKMTELRRILRNCKSGLEGTSLEAIQQAEHDVQQVEEILDGLREKYEPFRTIDQQETQGKPDTKTPFSEEPVKTDEERPEQLRPLTLEDLQQNFNRLLEEATQYPKLREKILHWKAYGHKLIEFEELQELFDYLQAIRDELSLYARIQTIRAQAEAKHLQAVLKLTEQAEHLLLLEEQEDRGTYHRAEVLTDAAKALLDEKQNETEFEQVISYIRSPKTASNLITYGTLASYFVIATILGIQILYAPDPDFGAFVFKDYLSLVLWAIGLEGAKMTVTNVYEAYFKKEESFL